MWAIGWGDTGLSHELELAEAPVGKAVDADPATRLAFRNSKP